MACRRVRCRPAQASVSGAARGQEEAVVALRLVERHQEHAVEGRADRDLAVVAGAREQLAAAHRLQVREAGLHAEALARLDAPAQADVDRAGQMRGRASEQRALRGEVDAATLVDHAQARERGPDRRLVPHARSPARRSGLLRGRHLVCPSVSNQSINVPRTSRCKPKTAGTLSASTSRRFGALSERIANGGPAPEVECRSSSVALWAPSRAALRSRRAARACSRTSEVAGSLDARAAATRSASTGGSRSSST
jgi:hypothetical protein